MADEQTPLEDEPSEGTEEGKEKPEEKKPDQVIDYKVKFTESQKEALRLLGENQKLNEKLKDFAEKPGEKPKIEPDEIDRRIERKVREVVAPLTEKQEEEAVDRWVDNHPDAVDYLKEIQEILPESPGKSISQKLENAFLIAKKDAMKNAGKKEMAFSIYQREQAIAGGGGVSSPTSEDLLPELTAEEKMVAKRMGIKEETYAKRKIESSS